MLVARQLATQTHTMCKRLPRFVTASLAAAQQLLQQLLHQLPVGLPAMRARCQLYCVSNTPEHRPGPGNCHMTEHVLTGPPQNEHVTAGVTAMVTVTAGVTVSVTVTAGVTVTVTVTAGVTVLATKSGAERGTVGLAERVCADVGGAAGGKTRAK